ncbi:Hypothetical predicted protein [Pelobates cultripes]|uniref:Uncharacterized protein n=1 Tax=Pelobates cultripes TaxID=61616 RepID=A0AAD1T343_PELCU|nr:Hypothetical predicted protein [Pelobates cultripes]
MSKSMSKVLASAMDVMSTSLSKTFTRSLLQAGMVAIPPASQTSQPCHKALAKTKHVSKTIKMESIPPVTDGTGVNPQLKRAPDQAKAARLWKQAKTQPDSSESELMRRCMIRSPLWTHLMIYLTLSQTM